MNLIVATFPPDLISNTEVNLYLMIETTFQGINTFPPDVYICYRIVKISILKKES